MSKIGFLLGPGGIKDGIGDYIATVGSSGNSPVILANDLSGEIELALAYNSVMAFRVVRDGSEQYAVPDYSLPPAEAALKHWAKISQYFPVVVMQNRSRIWILPINEPDKNRSDWLGEFSYEIAMIANAQGYKIASLGFSAGEPEKDHWKTPGMLKYLRYCAQNPSHAGVCLHEYSLSTDYLVSGGWMVGRFRFLHYVCDEMCIPRPTIIIGEFGWTDREIPQPDIAMRHIHEAENLYAPHGNILGAGIWYLGAYNNTTISQQVQKLIQPITEASASEACRGLPRTQYRREYWVLPQEISKADANAIFELAFPGKITVGWSYDDAGIGDLADVNAVLWEIPSAAQNTFRSWYATNYPGVKVAFRNIAK